MNGEPIGCAIELSAGDLGANIAARDFRGEWCIGKLERLELALNARVIVLLSDGLGVMRDYYLDHDTIVTVVHEVPTS